MRGSQHTQLNSAMSLTQSTGADVGGFCGDAPTPELFVRWIQLGVTHSRFCIHSGSHDTAREGKTQHTLDGEYWRTSERSFFQSSGELMTS